MAGEDRSTSGASSGVEPVVRDGDAALSPWLQLDPARASELPPAVEPFALSRRVEMLEDAAVANRRRGLPPAQRVASARASLEVANRAMSLHLEFLLAIRDACLAEEEGPEHERLARADRWAVVEAAAACGTSEYVTRMNLETALILAEKLPGVRALFAAGGLELSKVRVFAHAVVCLGPAEAREVEALVLPVAPRLPVSRLRAAAADAVALVTGVDAGQRAREAREERGVVFRRLSETMAEMVALLPAEDAAVVQNALVRLAEGAGSDADGRTADQRRADTLVDTIVAAAVHHLEPVEQEPVGLADPGAVGSGGVVSEDAGAGAVGSGGVVSEDANPDAVGSGGVVSEDANPDAASAEDVRAEVGRGAVASVTRPGRSGRRAPVHAVITVPWSTVVGESEEPGSLAGYGPLPAAIVRDLLGDATWQCAVVDDEHGTLLGLGRATFTPRYTPGKRLVDLVTLRDLTCRFPGCDRVAARCEIDHLVPYPRRATCSCNTGPLCPHHHRVKHEAGWIVEPSEDPDHPPGSLLWISPTGNRHVWRAPALTPAPRYALHLEAAENAVRRQEERRDVWRNLIDRREGGSPRARPREVDDPADGAAQGEPGRAVGEPGHAVGERGEPDDIGGDHDPPPF